MTHGKGLVLAMIPLLWLRAATAQVDAVESLDIRIPLAPQPVRIGDAVQLLYELQVTNFASSVVTLNDLIVLDATTHTELSHLDAKALTHSIEQFGKENQQPRSLAPGRHGVIYMTVSLNRAPPRALSHRFTLSLGSASQARSTTLTTDATPVDASPVPDLGPPLRGGTWAALYDPNIERGHRRVWFAVDGHVHLPGRFAMDFFGVDATGKTHKAAGERPADYFGYGADVLAVADGTVIAARDEFKEAATIAEVAEVAIGNGTGNYVALDIGSGRVAFYENLQPGLAVKVGQQVRRGDRLGALGLTGETHTPHLHFHVANANAPLAAEGMPFQFSSYRLLGGYDAMGDFGERPWRGLPQPRTLAKSRPASNVVVSFE